MITANNPYLFVLFFNPKTVILPAHSQTTKRFALIARDIALFKNGEGSLRAHNTIIEFNYTTVTEEDLDDDQE